MGLPTWEDGPVSIITGNALDVLREMPDESVNCCVTSPPYWNLRDYQTASWQGGDSSCDHRQEMPRFNGPKQTSAQVSGHASKAESHARTHCGSCGARRVDSQLGSEPTPDEYIVNLVAVFHEVRRALKSDGVLFLNLGDTYAADRSYEVPDGKWTDVGNSNGMRASSIGLKSKDLIGIPWLAAFGLRADGWYLRQDIIWSKRNPMTESVKDRCTKAHEYLFLLSKSGRYFFNSEAIAEEAQNGGKVVTLGEKSFSKGQANGRGVTPSGNGLAESYTVPEKRNKRSVWEIATEPFPEAHFAAYPTELVKPCILAGCPKGGLVLDPFCGSGTTLLVAEKLGCRGLGIELNPDYVEIAKRRLVNRSFCFPDEEVSA